MLTPNTKVKMAQTAAMTAARWRRNPVMSLIALLFFFSSAGLV